MIPQLTNDVAKASAVSALRSAINGKLHGKKKIGQSLDKAMQDLAPVKK